MVLPGYRYNFKIARIDTRGAWLATPGPELLVPSRECPRELAPGMDLAVFVYLDRNNQLAATTHMPLAQVGEFAQLQARSSGPHGTFLAWGLDKDLLAPFSEQTRKMLDGRQYLVRICLDDQNRPIASSRLEKFLVKENRDLQPGDEVEVLIWAFTDLGAKVIVNHTYEALLYRNDIPTGMKTGDRTTGYVARIRGDNRIDISLRRTGKEGIDDASATIMEALAATGSLPLHDQSPPELIKNRLGMSKKAFKKAVGGLYKQGLIELSHQGIKLRRK